MHRSDPGLMLGYWRRPQEEREVYRGDWFVGGDIAVIDREGYVFHRGRATDLMKALGYRVSPLEVEAAISEHPSVAEVACAEVKVRADISVIAAFVVPNAGIEADAADIERFAAERLAAYKRPRSIVFVKVPAAHRQRQDHAPGVASPRRLFHRLTAVASEPRPGFFHPALCSHHKIEC